MTTISDPEKNTQNSSFLVVVRIFHQGTPQVSPKMALDAVSVQPKLVIEAKIRSRDQELSSKKKVLHFWTQKM